jgi:hypothetical protein
MASHLARGNDRISTLEEKAATARHTPESIGSAGKGCNGHESLG